MLWADVCLSLAGVLSKWMNGSRWFSVFGLYSAYPLCYKGIRVSPRIRLLPSGILSQIVLLFRHGTLTVASVDVLRRVHTTRDHGPCTRHVNTGVILDTRPVLQVENDVVNNSAHADLDGPCSRVSKNDARVHGPCSRPVNTVMCTRL